MKNKLLKISYTALFVALGIVLPFFTGQIKEIGDTLLPMHLPVMICGIICGPVYGAFAGIAIPLLRGIFFSRPPIYPNAIWMALELATYGAVLGLSNRFRRNDRLPTLYFCIILSQICGRIVWGISKAVLLGMAGKSFGIEAFLVGGFVDAAAGIVLQLILIPIIMKGYKVKRT